MKGVRYVDMNIKRFVYKYTFMQIIVRTFEWQISARMRKRVKTTVVVISCCSVVVGTCLLCT